MSNNYERYNNVLTRSIKHIYRNLLRNKNIAEVFESMSKETDRQVCITLNGTLNGELVLHLPEETLISMTKQLVSNDYESQLNDVAGELANQISGTFVNQLQFLGHKIELSAPWFNEDQLTIKALYDNINLSFETELGGFDVDLYFNEN